jgi:hypothetical protein
MFAQSPFSKLSKPEKYWVIIHPFVAKKAMRISKQVLVDVDSIRKSEIIGTDNNGGKLDAFKHAYWIASLTCKIGKRKTKKLGIAHEKGNYLQFRKHEIEDRFLPDSVSSEMDLKNNEIGISLINDCKIISSQSLQNEVLFAVKNGKLYIIKKDKNGNFLTKDGIQLQINEWVGKWGIPKYIVPSNE